MPLYRPFTMGSTQPGGVGTFGSFFLRHKRWWIYALFPVFLTKNTATFDSTTNTFDSTVLTFDSE